MGIVELEKEYLSGKISVGKIMSYYLTIKNKDIALSLKRLKENTSPNKLVHDMIKEKEWDNLAKKFAKYLNKSINRREKNGNN